MASSAFLDPDTTIYYAKKYRQALATAPACAISIVAGAPLENVKTRMQSRYFSSALDCTKYTYRTEGLRGFWVGTWAPLVSISITRTTTFSIYRFAKYRLDSIIESITGSSPLQHVNKAGTYPNISTVVCFAGSGMISGALLSVALTPVELIKNCTQTSVLMASPANPKPTSAAPSTNSPVAKSSTRVSSYAAATQILHERGFPGLFTGFKLHFLRDCIGTGLYFGVYETVKQSINSAYGATQANTTGAIAFAGLTCGVLSWSLTYPLDSMKTQAQNRLVGAAAMQSAAASATKSAVRGISKWKGFEMMILRSAVQNMIQMTLFEHFKVKIDGLSFSDGSKTLPEVQRELGRDRRVRRLEDLKNDKI